MYPINTIGNALSFGCGADGRGCLPVPAELSEPAPSSFMDRLKKPITVPVLGSVVPRDALAGAIAGLVVGAALVAIAKR